MTDERERDTQAPNRVSLNAGERVGPYKLVRPIGSGGMGSVFEAVHEELEKRCAIKILNREFTHNLKIVRRFFNEARVVARIRHENIVDVYDFGKTPNLAYYFVMELLEGSSLSDELKDKGKLELRRSCFIAGQIARALAASHRAGVVHRDLKPSNLLLIRRAQIDDFVKVLDFGVAKIIDKSKMDETETGMVIGSTRFMSPEQCRGGREVDHRCDVYSLGMVLYNMLAGRLPFDADNPGDLMVQHLTMPPTPLSHYLPDVPREIAELTERALAKSPADRFQNIEELADLLVPFGGPASVPEPATRPPRTFDFDLDDTPPLSLPPVTSSKSEPTPTDRKARRSRSRRLAAFLLSAGVVAVAVGVTVAILTRAWLPATASVTAPATAPVAAPVAAPAPAPAPVAEIATITIISEPSSARVLMGETPIGDTPIELRVRRADEALRVSLHKAGFEPLVRNVIPTADQHISLMLRAQATPESHRTSAKRKTRATQVEGLLAPSY